MGAGLGLVLPLGFAVGVTLGEQITQAQWTDAMATLAEVTTEARILVGAGEEGGEAAAPDPSGAGLFARLSAQLQAAGDGMGEAVVAVGRYRDAAVVLMSQADALFGATLRIIGVFALRTLILPALLLWGALALMRRSVGAG